MPHLELSFLGTFQARLDSVPLTHFRSAKVEGLLAYLAVESGQAHRRDALAGLLWPEEPESSARQNLRQALYLLQQRLGKDASGPGAFLQITRESVQFNMASDHTLDVSQFLSKLGANQLEDAVNVYRAELLIGLSCDSVPFEEWLYFTRERLHNLALAALAQLTDQTLNQAVFTDAQAYARRQIALEPWRESAHRQLMLALALNGDANAALAQYENCRRALLSELGAEPDAETTLLFERIRSGELRPDASHTQHPAARRSLPDWGEAPSIGTLHGREDELRQLQIWLTQDHCRLVSLIGMGGIGKTTLAAQACRQFADQFERVIWRSLLNAPPLADVLQTWLNHLTDGQSISLPDSLDAQLSLLFDHLRQSRCLLVLDNGESIMQGGGHAGHYRAGYEDYGQLFKRMGEINHISCLLLTSRELPQEAMRLERETPLVQSLALSGVSVESGQVILSNQGLAATPAQSQALIERYSGNPLALMLVGETIQELFAGDIPGFLGESSPIFDDIRDVLDQQFARLTSLEQEILVWLAIEREPCSLQQLRADIARPISNRDVLEAVNSLRRRSLLQKVSDGATGISSPAGPKGPIANGAGFALQNVVTEYVTDTLVDQICREMESGKPVLLRRHALLKAQAKEYVRQTQERLIMQPIAERLLAALGLTGIAERCRRMLAALQLEPAPSYTAGNLLNLLLHLNVDVTGLNLTGLSVWQSYLRGADLPEVDFSGADLTGSAFNDYVGSVNCVTFSPDGQLLAAGADSGSIYLWHMTTLQLVGVCTGHHGQVGSIAFSADGRFMVSGGDDTTVRIWEVEHRQPLRILSGHTSGVTSVLFHADGETLVSGSTDQTVRVWQAATGQLTHILHEHTATVSALAFSPDGTTLASSGFDQVVRLWDWPTKQLRHTLHGHTGPVVTIAYCPRPILWNQTMHTVLASGSHDQTLRVWDAESGELLMNLSGHVAPVTSTVFSADGTLLMSGSDDQLVRVWDMTSSMSTTGLPIRMLRGHFGVVNALAVQPHAPEGQTVLVSGSFDRSLRLWDVRSGQALTILRGHSKWLQAIVFASDSRLLVGGSDGQNVRVWDGHTGRALHTLRGHTSLTEKISFRAGGTHLASSSWDKTARVWDVARAQTRHVLRGHTAAVVSAAIGVGPRGRSVVATGSLDQTARLWDLETGNGIVSLNGHTDRVVAFAFHPDGTTLASGSWDHTIALWDMTSGERRRVLVGHTDPIEGIAFHPNGALLASGSWNGSVRVWDLSTGAVRHTFTDLTNGVEMVAFSPDGRLLAGCACDHLVCVWDVKQGRLLHKLHGHTSWVRCIAFSPDSAVLVSGSDDGTIRYWDVAMGGAGEYLQTLAMDDPYSNMKITGAVGISVAQRGALKALGAVE